MEDSDDDLPYKPTSSVPRLKRLVLVALATIESLLMSGVIFGWSALLILMENEGVYVELCELGTSCAERTERFELIYTAASTVFALSVWPTGFVLDRFGPRISCCLGSILFFLGLLLFGVSNSRDYDYFLPGFVLIAIGGPPIVFSFMHLSNLFPSRKATIITIFNVMLDASSMDFAAFKLLYEATFVPSRYTFYAYLLVPVFTFLTSAYLAPDQPYEIEDDSASSEAEDMTLWRFWDQLTSAAYLISLVYNCCQLFRVNFYLGSVDYQLRALADEETAQRWATYFAWILPLGGIASVPVVGWFLDDLGLLVSMFALNITATVFGFLICVPVLEVQLISFVLMAFWRAFHFSALSSYVAILFGFRNFGQLWGLSFFISGVVNINLYYLSKKVAEDLNGDFLLPNVMLVITSSLLFVFPFWMLWKSRSAAHYVIMDGKSTALEVLNDPQLEKTIDLQGRRRSPSSDWA